MRSQGDEGVAGGTSWQGLSQDGGIPTRHTCMHNWCVCQSEGWNHTHRGQDLRAWLGSHSQGAGPRPQEREG